MLGLKVQGPYTLDDMAAEGLGLMDKLGLRTAHVVGASTGGMIAQLIAANYPDRTRSLVSIMSSSGDRRLPQSTPEARNALFAKRPDPSDREKIVAHMMNVYRIIASRGYQVPDDVLRPRLEASINRSYYPKGGML